MAGGPSLVVLLRLDTERVNSEATREQGLETDLVFARSRGSHD